MGIITGSQGSPLTLTQRPHPFAQMAALLAASAPQEIPRWFNRPLAPPKPPKPSMDVPLEEWDAYEALCHRIDVEAEMNAYFTWRAFYGRQMAKRLFNMLPNASRAGGGDL